jgi:DNA-binding MarR family transcriptional regulator
MTPTALEQVTQIVQVAYPQVYLACHTRHQRKGSTEHRLSPRDAMLLAHLDERSPLTPSRLAAHLGIAQSTLSEALKRLSALGFERPATRASESGPRPVGRPGVLLSAQGARAIRDTSVLETARLRAALAMLSPRERARIADGMATLAAACRRLTPERGQHFGGSGEAA